MLDKEELLFDELYEKTKSCGRTQFIKLLMEKDKKIKRLKEKLDEYQKLKKELDYISCGEYCSQLRFERDMLQNVIDYGEVSKEDKEFIDMTHRNTELLEENEYLKKQLEGYQIQNLNLKTNIMIQKQALPSKEIKDKTFYDLYDMPTYKELKKQLEEYKEQTRIKDEYLSIITDLANNYNGYSKINDLGLLLLAVYEDDSFNTVKGLKSLVKNIGRYAKYALDSEVEETIYLNCYGQKLNILKEVL